MFMWSNDKAVDVSRRAVPCMKTGSNGGANKTQLEHLETFFTALGVFRMLVDGRACYVGRTSELCTWLHQTLGGTLATPTAMHQTLTAEYVALLTMLDQVQSYQRRLVTMRSALAQQSSTGLALLRRIHPSVETSSALAFVDYIAESYQKAIDRIALYREAIERHLQDIDLIVEYMPIRHDASNAALMFDAIVGLLEACTDQRARIAGALAACRHQVSPAVIASQLQVCNEHMCASLELYAAVYRTELLCCRACTAAKEAHAHPTGSGDDCTQCIDGLRRTCQAMLHELA